MGNRGCIVFSTGILGGVILMSFVMAYKGVGYISVSEYEIQGDDWSTLIAGLGGALIGGIISAIIAIGAAKIESRKRAEERAILNKSQVLNIIVKVKIIMDQLETLHIYIDDCKKKLSHADKEALWSVVVPTTTHPEVPVFVSSDFIPFAVSGRGDFIDKIMQIKNNSEVVIDTFKKYSLYREAYDEFSAPFATFDSKGVPTGACFNADNARIAKFKTHLMNGMLNSILPIMEETMDSAKSIIEELNEFSREYLRGTGNFIALKPNTEREAKQLTT